MVRVFANDYTSGFEAGQDAAVQAWRQINETHTTDLAHVSLLLHNFGWWMDPPNPTSFLDSEDVLDPLPQYDPGEPPPPDYYDYLQLWMTVGREKARLWMQDFIAGYIGTGGPPPARVHQDTEVGLRGECCSINHTRILAAAYRDARWGNPPYPGIPVPGFGTQTMRDLYEQAKDDYRWDDLPLYDPTPGALYALDFNAGPRDDDNRKYFLWYWSICQTSLDSCMNYSLYGKPTPTSPAALIKLAWPNCLVSNYEDTNTDAKGEADGVDTFGWYTGRNHANPGGYVPTRYSVRGQTIGFGTGAQYIWNDFIEREYQPNGPIVRRSLWHTMPGVASGDFSAPVLYPNQNDHQQPVYKNYYLRNWPTVTTEHVTLTNGRRWVESILNSNPGTPPERIFPWVPVPESSWDLCMTAYLPPCDYTTPSAHFRDVLAMLRAKKTREIGIWWNNGLSYPPDLWEPLKQIMEWVYETQVVRADMLHGASVEGDMNVDQLRYTLEDQNPTNEYIEIVAAPSGPFWMTALEVTFANAARPQGYGVLNLECAVKPAGGGTAADIRAEVWVWNPALNHPIGDWEQATGVDDFGVDPPAFGFFAPKNEGDPDPDWYETRRVFDNEPPEQDQRVPMYWKTDGTMDLKIVLKRLYPLGQFSTRFDLVQLIRTPIIEGPVDGRSQGADYDYSRTVDVTDATAFLAAWGAGAPGADFNNDGQVNTLDVAAFTAAYNGPP